MTDLPPRPRPSEPMPTLDMTKLPDLPASARRKVYSSAATVTSISKQRKVARNRHFEIHCDEPHWLGGEDLYPQPLTYLVAAVGF